MQLDDSDWDYEAEDHKSYWDYGNSPKTEELRELQKSFEWDYFHKNNLPSFLREMMMKHVPLPPYTLESMHRLTEEKVRMI